MAQELKIIQDYYDFSLLLLKRILLFPRNIRHGLGRSIEARAEALLTLLLRAKYAPRNDKLDFLKEFNVELEMIRFQIRQAVDLKAIPLRAQQNMMEQLFSIGQQVGGWIRQLSEDQRK